MRITSPRHSSYVTAGIGLANLYRGLACFPLYLEWGQFVGTQTLHGQLLIKRNTPSSFVQEQETRRKRTGLGQASHDER